MNRNIPDKILKKQQEKLLKKEKDKQILKERLGKSIYRHKRIFDYVVVPFDFDNEKVKVKISKNEVEEIPINFFFRDFEYDSDIDFDKFMKLLNQQENPNVYFSLFYNVYYLNENEECNFIYSDFENAYGDYPKWIIVKTTFGERLKKYNPYNFIMPVNENKIDELEKDLEYINQIRLENDYFDIQEFKEFEFGLIKFLEKKYLKKIKSKDIDEKGENKIN
jgi:hypothetical protein